MLRYNQEFLLESQEYHARFKDKVQSVKNAIEKLKAHEGSLFVVEQGDFLFCRSFFHALLQHQHIKELKFQNQLNEKQLVPLCALVEDNPTLLKIDLAGKAFPQSSDQLLPALRTLSGQLLFNEEMSRKNPKEYFDPNAEEIRIINTRCLCYGRFGRAIIEHSAVKRIIVNDPLTRIQFAMLSLVLSKKPQIHSVVIQSKEVLDYDIQEDKGIIGMPISVFPSERLAVRQEVSDFFQSMRLHRSIAQVYAGENQQLEYPYQSQLSGEQKSALSDCLKGPRGPRVLRFFEFNEELIDLIPTGSSVQELSFRQKIESDKLPLLRSFLQKNSGILEVLCLDSYYKKETPSSDWTTGFVGEAIRNELAVNRLINSLLPEASPTKFCVSSLPISDLKAEIIATRLTTCTTLKSFELWADISEGGLDAIISALASNSGSALRRFSLINTPISDRLYESILVMLSRHPFFTVLQLVKVGLTDRHIHHLSEWLKSNPPVTVLNLLGNKIGNQGLSTLCEALETNCRVSSLTLSGNSFDMTAIPALTRLFSQTKSIACVSLESSCLTEQDVKPFITEISKTNKSVVSLVLSHHTERNTYKKGGLDGEWVSTPYKKQILDIIAKFTKANAQLRDKLFTHVRRAEYKEVDKLFTYKISPHCVDESGNTALHVALSQNLINTQLVECLMKHGSHPFLMNKDGRMPLDMLPENSLDDIRNMLQRTTAAVEPNAKKIKVQHEAPARKPTFMDNFLSRKKNPQLNETADTDGQMDGPSQTKIAKIEKLIPELPVQLVRDGMKILNPFNSAYFAAQNGDSRLLKNCLSMMNSAHVYPDGNTLWHLVASSNAIDCLHLLYPNSQVAKVTNLFGQLPLHLVCLNSDLSHSGEMIELLLAAYPEGVNAMDAFGNTPLFSVVGGFIDSPISASSDRMRAHAAKLLLAKNANPNAVVDDLNSQHPRCSVLQKAISRGLYRVVKVLIGSSLCDLAYADGFGWSVLHYAVYSGQIDILARLLIQPQINVDSINQYGKTARQMVREAQFSSGVQNSALVKEQMEALFTARSQAQYPSIDSAVHWVKNLQVRYGSRWSKGLDLELPFNEEHAHLQNAVRPQLQNPGNLLSASLTFIVSQGAHHSGANLRRVAIKINMTFTPKFHATNAWQKEALIEKNDSVSSYKKFKRSPDALERIMERFDAAPSDIQGSAVDEVNQKSTPLTKAAITSLYQSSDQSAGDYDFERHFHHSEHALFDHLQQSDVIGKILSVLQGDSQFKPGAKIYALILNAFSKNYLCPNCSVSTMGFQNTTQGAFFRALKARLVELGCVLPKMSDLRAITLFSANQPYGQPKKLAGDHMNFQIDLRVYPNNKILSQDITVIQSNSTLFTSRK